MVLKNSKSPLYYQLAEIILSEIESKNLKRMINYLLRENMQRNMS